VEKIKICAKYPLEGDIPNVAIPAFASIAALTESRINRVEESMASEQGLGILLYNF
jgi:hypothetical protein